MKRQVKDIKDYTVYTDYRGVDGWVVLLRYYDGKQAMFTIDAPGNGEDRLQLVTDCIKKQLKQSA